jgi:hypothetical protein
MRKMKIKRHTTPARLGPTDEDIRDYAYHLYLQNGCIAGRDLENWLEAKACLESCIPKSKSRARLHHHTHHRAGTVITTTSLEARNLST